MKPKTYHSEIVERIFKNAPLEIRLRVYLQGKDINNWKNGEYFGDINDELDHLLNDIERWQTDGAPLRCKLK